MLISIYFQKFSKVQNWEKDSNLKTGGERSNILTLEEIFAKERKALTKISGQEKR